MGTVEFPGIGEAPDVVPWRDGADLLLQQLSRHKPIDGVCRRLVLGACRRGSKLHVDSEGFLTQDNRGLTSNFTSHTHFRNLIRCLPLQSWWWPVHEILQEFLIPFKSIIFVFEDWDIFIFWVVYPVYSERTRVQFVLVGDIEITGLLVFKEAVETIQPPLGEVDRGQVIVLLHQLPTVGAPHQHGLPMPGSHGHHLVPGQHIVEHHLREKQPSRVAGLECVDIERLRQEDVGVRHQDDVIIPQLLSGGGRESQLGGRQGNITLLVWNGGRDCWVSPPELHHRHCSQECAGHTSRGPHCLASCLSWESPCWRLECCCTPARPHWHWSAGTTAWRTAAAGPGSPSPPGTPRTWTATLS